MSEASANKATGLLRELPPPPNGKSGWPWNTERDPGSYSGLAHLPKISIVTPSYNQGRFIEKTIRSVLLQNYPHLEYIVIDGNSTDESAEVIDKYSDWISYKVSEPDNGQTDAINKGLRRCTGDIFNWLNSDDFYYDDCFLTLAENFKIGNTGMLAGDYVMFCNDGKDDDKLIDFRLHPTVEETMAIVQINQPSSFFSLPILKSLGELNTKLNYVMDQDIWKKYLLTYGQDEVVYVSKPLVNFRLHSESKTRLFTFEKEYNMIFSSMARKTGLPDSARFLEELHGIEDYGGYDFKFEFDERTGNIARGAVTNWIYQIARRAFTQGKLDLFKKCAQAIDSSYLNKDQKNYLNKLKVKRILNKLYLLPLNG